jgi:extracellular elastinolytic metalloproteinase
MKAIFSIFLSTFICFAANAFPKNNFFEQKARAYLSDHKSTFNLSAADIVQLAVTDQYTDDYSQVTHIWFSQTAHGIRLRESSLGLHISKSGEILYATGEGYKDLQLIAKQSRAATNAQQAVLSLMNKLGLDWTGTLKISSREDKFRTTFEPIPGINDIATTTELVYTFDDHNQIRLVWNIHLDDLKNGSYWDICMDAITGEIIYQRDAIVRCMIGPYHTHEAHGEKHFQHEVEDLPATLQRTGVNDGSSYRVYPLGIESPIHGNRALIRNPADPTASPFGWHDTNGSPGPEHTITRGNNVHAYDDPFASNNANFSPNGGNSLSFDYALDFTQATTADPNRSAAITNLFYWNNIMHDVAYAYGFTEAAGNFQQNNYGRGGRGSDIVRAEAQDGALATNGTKNNANFSAPVDGLPGRMQMFMWDSRPSSRFVVITPLPIAGTYTNGSAIFGPVVFSVTGQVVAASSSGSTLACSNITNNISGRIALIDRGDCEFQLKVQNAQNAGAIGVIIVNNVPNEIINMAGTNPNITIPSVFVTQETGQILKNNLNQGLQVSLIGESPTFGNDVDGSFENGVVAHEYGHGISIRSTGGPLNAGCLTVREQMGEGWSDFYGLALTARPTHTRTTARGIGNYAVGFPVTGPGIRPFPYTTDMSINPHTYDYIASMSSGLTTDVHSVGSVWCAMLWEVYWNLVDKYGFSEDFAHGDKGNNIALRLVTEGLKLQKCNPGFVDGRDAILKADSILYGGKHSCQIWEGFAKRGLGKSAVQGSSNDLTDNRQAFDVPTCVAIVAPKAQFSVTSQEICSGQSLSFTNNSTGDITGRQWSFGDGTVSSENNPTKTYSSAGTFLVKLTVTGPGGADSSIISIIVKPAPVVNISGDSVRCAGSTALLTATGANSYVWSTGANTASVTVTPSTTTLYTVTGNSNGCSTSAGFTVHVQPLPTVSAGADQIICTGDSAILTASGADLYRWSNGSTSASITVFPATSTTYTVFGTSNGCENSSQVRVSVNPPPVISITPDEQSICAGQSVTLQAGGGSRYEWSTGASSAAVTVSPASTTTYSVTAFQGSCSSTGNVTVIVLAPPQVTASADVTACPGENITLSVSGNASTYTWNTGATASSIVVSPTATTTYIVTGTNNNACTQSDSVTVNIRKAPEISISGINAICEGSSTLLTAHVSPDAGEILWSNLETGNSIRVTPTSSGSFSASVCSALCPSLCSSAEITVNISQKPSAGFEATPSGLSVSFENTTQRGSVYSWQFGDGNTSTQTSPQHLYAAPGTYTVTLIAKNGGCEDVFQSEVAVVGSSVSDNGLIKGFELYPNPSKGTVTLSLSLQKSHQVQVLVLTTAGQKVFAKNLGLLQETIQNFDFSEFPSGSYFFQILMEDEAGVKQMILLK